MEIFQSGHVPEGANGSLLPGCNLHSHLERLQTGQNELRSKLESLAIKQQEAFDLHRDTNVRLDSLTELIHEAVLAGYEKRLVLHDSLVRARTLFDAGKRLVGTSEILEMVLLELPSEDILFAQLVNKRFRAVIGGSSRLQQKLFAEKEALENSTDEVILNPMIVKESTLSRLPLYLDGETMGLRYCHRSNRRRLFGKAATVEHNAATGESWIQLQLRGQKESQGFKRWDFLDPDPGTLDAGSWRNMSLSRPICRVEWELKIPQGQYGMQRTWKGSVSGARTMDHLLDALAACKMDDLGLQRA